jgi:hypothetical protein
MLQDSIVNFPLVWNELELTVIFFKLCYMTSMSPIACGTFYVQHVISEFAVTFERFVV